MFLGQAASRLTPESYIYHNQQQGRCAKEHFYLSIIISAASCTALATTSPHFSSPPASMYSADSAQSARLNPRPNLPSRMFTHEVLPCKSANCWQNRLAGLREAVYPCQSSSRSRPKTKPSRHHTSGNSAARFSPQCQAGKGGQGLENILPGEVELVLEDEERGLSTITALRQNIAAFPGKLLQPFFSGYAFSHESHILSLVLFRGICFSLRQN